MREIALWPAWEVRLIDEYLQRQPSSGDRVEIAVARLCALFFNVHRDKDQSPKMLKDYLPFYDPWPQLIDTGRYSEVDLEMMKALGK